MNTWKRTSERGMSDTIYTATTGYKVVGRDQMQLAARGGGVVVRRFTAYDPQGNKLPTGNFGTLKAAKAFADEHAANTGTPAAKRTPGRTTVTHPDNTVSTRTSKTMAYTHAVEVSPATAAEYAAWLTRQADKADAEAAKLREAIKFNEVRIRNRGFGSDGQNDLYSHEARLTGTDVYTWCSRDGLTRRLDSDGGGTEKVRPYLLRAAEESAKWHDTHAAKNRAEAAEILAKGEPVGIYYVSRWSTRADLAHSYAAGPEMAYVAVQGRKVRVVAVDTH